MEYINLFVKSIFVDNMVFAYFLGMCSYLAVSKNVKTATGLGAAVIFVLLCTLPINYLINGFLTNNPFGVDLSVLSLIIFKISRTSWSQVGGVFKIILFFLSVNIIAIYLFSPAEGVKIYGTETILLGSGHYALRAEQLFYEFNIILKYFTVVPSIFIFIPPYALFCSKSKIR